MDKIKVNLDDCNNWEQENIAECGSGRIEMSRYVTGTIDLPTGETVCVQKPARTLNGSGGSGRIIPACITLVHQHGDLLDDKKYELIVE